MDRLKFLDQRSVKSLEMREFDVTHSERKVPGVLWLSDKVTPGAPLVCLGHGASGDRYQNPIPVLARRFVEESGFFCVSIDGPVHGRRQRGKGGREAFWPEWKRPGSGEEMVEDWRAVLSALSKEKRIGSGALGYWGLSMGTIYGAPLVAAEKRIKVAVLGLMGLCGPDSYLKLLSEAVGKIECPILFLQQLEDELFEREAYAALFDSLASKDKRLHANPGLHPQVPLEELDNSVLFLTNYLNGKTLPRGAAFSISE